MTRKVEILANQARSTKSAQAIEDLYEYVYTRPAWYFVGSACEEEGRPGNPKSGTAAGRPFVLCFTSEELAHSFVSQENLPPDERLVFGLATSEAVDMLARVFAEKPSLSGVYFNPNNVGFNTAKTNVVEIFRRFNPVAGQSAPALSGAVDSGGEASVAEPPPVAHAPVVGLPGGTRQKLRSVAKAQRGVLICLLIGVLSFISSGVNALALQVVPREWSWLFGVLFLVTGCAYLFYLFRLSTWVYGTGKGILMALATGIPLIGFWFLFVINGQTIAIMKKNGIRVGLLGADPSKIYTDRDRH